jgi:hypothetical protein
MSRAIRLTVAVGVALVSLVAFELSKGDFVFYPTLLIGAVVVIVDCLRALRSRGEPG